MNFDLFARTPSFRDRPLLGYGFALAAVAVALGIRLILGERLVGFAFLTIFPAVFITTLVAGLWPGVMATVVGGLAAWHLFVPPAFEVESQVIGLVGYAIVAMLLCYVTDAMVSTLMRNIELTRQKDALLSEIHHRLRNQLQIVSTMLTMQVRTVGDGTAAEPLREAARRIHLVARVHDRLFKAERDDADLNQYLSQLCHELVESSATGAIDVRVRAERVVIDNDRILPLALIVSELVSNSVRHGLRAGRRGTIDVSLAQAPGAQLELIVKDDGDGLPEDFAIGRPGHLGLRLVDLFAKQLGGTLQVIRNGGAKFRVTFPV